MLTLGVDTATSWGSVGLFRDGPLGEIACKRVARKNDPLVPSLQQLLNILHIEKTSLELIAVALGPGSFTSLRVGVSLAKGLAMALKLPLVGVPSLPMLKQRADHWKDHICALITDRPTQAYVRFYEQGKLSEKIEVLDVDALRQRLEGFSAPVLLIGPGANQLYEAMGQVDRVEVASEVMCQPSGMEVARLGIEKFKATGADDLAALEPLYHVAPAIDPGVVKR